MKSVVLCYNLKGTPKGKKIGMIFGFLGYKVRHVTAEEYRLPLGTLIGISPAGTEEEAALEKEPSERQDAAGFSEEMLVIHAETEEMLDRALFLMKKEKVRVDLKAMVTQTNRDWDSLALYEEIKKEHEFMKQQEQERKQKS